MPKATSTPSACSSLDPKVVLSGQRLKEERWTTPSSPVPAVDASAPHLPCSSLTAAPPGLEGLLPGLRLRTARLR